MRISFQCSKPFTYFCSHRCVFSFHFILFLSVFVVVAAVAFELVDTLGFTSSIDISKCDTLIFTFVNSETPFN